MLKPFKSHQLTQTNSRRLLFNSHTKNSYFQNIKWVMNSPQSSSYPVIFFFGLTIAFAMQYDSLIIIFINSK